MHKTGSCFETFLIQLEQTFHLVNGKLQTLFKLSIVGYVFTLGDPSRRTTGGRNEGDHSWHKSWSGLLRHGGQCGGGRGAVHPRRGWLHHR